MEGGEALVFASGMAAVAAVLLPVLEPGDVLVAPHDAYPGVRTVATEHLERSGVEVRLVASSTPRSCEAAEGASVLWVETPSNPGLEVIDVARPRRAATRAWWSTARWRRRCASARWTSAPTW